MSWRREAGPYFMSCPYLWDVWARTASAARVFRRSLSAGEHPSGEAQGPRQTGRACLRAEHRESGGAVLEPRGARSGGCNHMGLRISQLSGPDLTPVGRKTFYNESMRLLVTESRT